MCSWPWHGPSQGVGWGAEWGSTAPISWRCSGSWRGSGGFFFFVAVSFFPFLTSPPKYSASVSAPGGLDLLLEELGPFLYPLGGEREWGC